MGGIQQTPVDKKLREIGDRAKEVFSTNLVSLMRETGMTNSEAAQRFGITVSALTGYKKGTTLPPVDKLILIASSFNVSLGELVMSDRNSESSGKDGISSSKSRGYCQFYRGSYAVHFFNASQPLGKDTLPVARSVNSGVILIREKASPAGELTYPALAVLGLETGDVAGIKSLVDSSPDASFKELGDMIARDYDKKHSLYQGHLAVNGSQADIKLKKEGSCVTIVMQNIAMHANKPSMRCNIGVMQSISRGVPHLPCAQKVILSSIPLTRPVRSMQAGDKLLPKLLDSNAIAEFLQIGAPQIDLHTILPEFRNHIKMLYSSDASLVPYISTLSEGYKDNLTLYFLENAFKEAMGNNAFRYIKIGEEEQTRLYRLVGEIGKEQGLFNEGGK